MTDYTDVYVAWAKDLRRVKIGMAKDSVRRVKHLSSVSGMNLTLHEALVLPTRKDARELERRVHKLLSGHRLKGEWFDLDGDLALVIVNNELDQLARENKNNPDWQDWQPDECEAA